jgi:hypothetical protein
MDHRAVGEDCQGRTFATNGSLAQGYGIVTLGNLAELVAGPGRYRSIVMTVERSVVEPLRLQEDHRIWILDCRYQKTLGVAWIRWHHRLDAAHMGEQSFRTLAMSLPAEDSAAGRHPNNERAGKLAVGAISQSCSLRNDLVVRRVHVVGKLDLDARSKAIRSHADGGTDDTQLADWRIEAAAFAVFRLQALSRAKDSAEEPNILAKHDDIVIAFHHHIHGVAYGLDHSPTGHG